MGRKPVTEATQTSIVLKSRRRCCLCFWLNGEDEVKKGQIAHLDWNSENNAEENLAFLCLEHHDEYDSTPSVSKGLRHPEVKRWRDELYREMEYRFRTVKHRGFRLEIKRFLWENGPTDQFRAEFRLINTGEIAERTPTVSIRLPRNVVGQLPPRYQAIGTGLPSLGIEPMRMPIFDPWQAVEKLMDIFEPNGRVTVQELGGRNPVLMPGHHFEFEALVFELEDYPEGSQIELEYRVDAEGGIPTVDRLTATVPTAEEMIRSVSW